MRNPRSSKYFVLTESFFLCLRIIMTSTVQFDYKAGFCTVKIYNIMINCFLTLKSAGIFL